MADSGGLIAVGVDGAPHARRALDWALAEARLRRWRCLLIHAYEFGIVGPAPLGAPELEHIKAVEETLDQEVAFARASGLPVGGKVVGGGASKALVDASHHADLLVVGSRGRGGFKGALLGSVSTACVHHAACPVVVVPPPDRVDAAAHG
jgi:nucleotide-binding universal stress UspA family protein